MSKANLSSTTIPAASTPNPLEGVPELALVEELARRRKLREEAFNAKMVERCQFLAGSASDLLAILEPCGHTDNYTHDDCLFCLLERVKWTGPDELQERDADGNVVFTDVEIRMVKRKFTD